MITMPLNRTAAYEQLIKFFLNQHGFKQRRSTTSLSLTIQTLIAQALEEDFMYNLVLWNN